MNDTELISKLFARSEDAVELISKQYGRTIYSVCFGILKNREDAEECRDDTYYKIWNAIPPYIPENFAGFAYAEARRVSLDRYRYNHRKARSGNTVSLDDVSEYCESISDDEDKSDGVGKEIDAFLSGIDARRRVLFIRRYFLCESPLSLAERFGMTENNICVILQRTRDGLKKYLERKGYTL